MSDLIPLYRLTVIIPSEGLNFVISELEKTAILSIGNYANVTWVSSEGIESFTPLDNANPAVGEVGVPIKVPARQLVFSIPRDDSSLNKVLNVLVASHPWEKPVIYVDESYGYG
ncbi:MAG TPA: hypothetical protein PKA63_08840 [Oligoflexia bacterium]|nr:hypothetical protein [Oligoflexia bacterium]HMP48757.1 hypothetical protein [Oligoflexia bacterium]